MRTQISKDTEGNSKLMFEVTPEIIEELRTLRESHFWKRYRELLINAKEAYFQSCLPENETNKLLKTIGMVAGINFTINQLPILIDTYDAARKKEAEKEKKQSQE
jgi:hypothetical protein